MTLEDFMKDITVFITPQGSAGKYNANVKGITPDDEYINFDIELSHCYTSQVLKDTVTSKLEEIFSCKYHYTYSDAAEDSLLYNGGEFR